MVSCLLWVHNYCDIDIRSFTIISFATSVKCYSDELLSIDRADVVVDWLKSINPSGCTSMLDAIKVTIYFIKCRHGYMSSSLI